jgi:hypothetical protein
MTGPDIAAGENPDWTQAKADAWTVIDRAYADYARKMFRPHEAPDPNLREALVSEVADALFSAQNGRGLGHLRT